MNSLAPKSLQRKSLRVHLSEFWRQRDLQAMVLPWILLVFIFSYLPMFGLVMAFQDFRMGDIVGFSRWVGISNFTEFFRSPDFWLIMRNTLAISLLRIVIGFPMPIILALLLNEVRGVWFKRSVQTISYLPHFISWVVVAGIVLDILSPDGGSLNSILMSLGVIKTPILFMGETNYFWPILIITDIWKSVGWNAIIYIAAISAINPELYQAADIDGADRLRKVWHITLAGIKPTIVVLLILEVGWILSAGFEQILLLTNNLKNMMVYQASEVIDTYVYRVGLSKFRYSYAAAVGLFKSVTSVVLLLGANLAAKKLGDESLL